MTLKGSSTVIFITPLKYPDIYLFQNWVILHAFLSSVDIFFFQVSFSKKKNLSGIPSECQTVWIQIRPDVLLGLIWVQTVLGYQHMTKFATSRE